MTVRTIAELKAKFEAGDRPTQQDFWDLLETMLTLETWPDPLPAASAANLTNIPIPDPLPAVSGEFLTNINRSDWVAVDAVPTYATSTSFVVSGDYTGSSYFVVGRRVRIHLNPTGYYFGTVTDAVYAGGPDTTTVTVDETIPTSALASVDVNLLVDSDIVITSLKPGSGNPLSVFRKSADGLSVEPWDVPVGSQAAPSLVELATDAEAQALTDATRAVTPAGLAAVAAVLATANRLMLRDGAGRAQVADPSAAADVATKSYADGKVAKTGGTMTGPLAVQMSTPQVRLEHTGANPVYFWLLASNGLFELQHRDAGGTYISSPLVYNPASQELSSQGGVLAKKSYVDALIPAGTRMVFYQATAPAGWTQYTAINDRVLRVVSGNGGGLGGSWTVAGLTVNGHALTVGELPAHTHWTVGDRSYSSSGGIGAGNSNAIGKWGSDDVGAGEDQYTLQPATGAADRAATSSVGSGQSHSHGISSNASWRPLYADVIVATKD